MSRTRSILVVILWCFGLLAAKALLSQEVARELVESVVVHNRRADFGVAIRGDTVTGEFVVENQAARPVTVSVGLGGCGCVGPSAQVLGAGSTTILKVDLKTDGLEGFLRRFPVLEVGRGRERVNLEIRGEILPPYRVAPEVVFLDSPQDSLPTLEIRGPIPFEILDYSTNLPLEGIDWKAVPNRERRVHRVVLYRGDDLSPGLDGEVTFRVSSVLGVHQVRLFVRTRSPR